MATTDRHGPGLTTTKIGGQRLGDQLGTEVENAARFGRLKPGAA
jgi:hypothetical protein